MIINMAAGLVSMEFGFQGPNFCVVSACATSNNCIGEAWRLIRDDEADVMLAGGSEASCVPLGVSGFAAMRALSVRNDDPEHASRPFDRDRDGFVLADGAATVVLEELEYAKKRGANILAELTGYGLTADAYHMTSPPPGGTGAARAMQLTLKRAGLNPEDVDYINAHATSTLVGDIAETEAIKSAFGAHAKKLAVSSTKSMTGGVDLLRPDHPGKHHPSHDQSGSPRSRLRPGLCSAQGAGTKSGCGHQQLVWFRRPQCHAAGATLPGLSAFLVLKEFGGMPIPSSSDCGTGFASSE
jgi:hypothetical protein